MIESKRAVRTEAASRALMSLVDAKVRIGADGSVSITAKNSDNARVSPLSAVARDQVEVGGVRR